MNFIKKRFARRGDADKASVISSSNQMQPKISIISAVYGVERYLDEFIGSVVNQSISFEDNIQLILVDDASVDGSLEKCKQWKELHPSIELVELEENQGQAGARNEGIKYAKGEWVCFADPDDILHLNFFKHMLRAVDSKPNCPMFIGQFRSYYDDTGREVNDHPLGWRFKKGNWLVNVKNEPKAIHCTVNNTIFKRELIEQHEIRFDPRVKPAYEDAVFANQYTLRTDNPLRCFVQNARYIYRKRSTKDSTLDQAWKKPEKFINQLKYGQLALLTESKELHGYVPKFIQNTVIYDLSWYFKRLLNANIEDLPITEEQECEFFDLVKQVFSYIAPHNVLNYSVFPLSQDLRQMMLSLTPYRPHYKTAVYVRGVNPHTGAIRVNYNTELSESDALESNDGAELLQRRKTITKKLIRQPLSKETYAWITPEEGLETGDLRIAGREVIFSIGGSFVNRSMTSEELLALAKRMSAKNAQMTADDKRFLQYAKTKAMTKVGYKDCWLLHDRPNKADDNAEHFMRYLLKEQPHINAVYAIAKGTEDWHRLEGEGFPLVNFGSREHLAALLNAKEYISSHANKDVENILSKSKFGEYMSARYHFLQHGVIKDDLSAWLNPKPFATFVTSSPAEFESIAADDSGYSFDTDDVLLSGLPRHDALFARRNAAPAKSILFMPTWRKYLKAKSNESKEFTKERFLNSEFFKNWLAVLQSEELARLHTEHGYSVSFFLHAEIAEYIDAFDLPDFITLANAGNQSIQDLFCENSIMVTDYSSVAFEMAALQRMTVYFQFDRDEFFAGHSYSKGYYDYDQDGFGPCYTNVSDILTGLSYLPENYDNLMKEIVLPRAQKALPLVDGKCCERIFSHIISNQIQ